MPQQKFKLFKPNSSNNKGQVLVEYLLLMVIAVACATILIKGLIGREGGGPGSGKKPGIIIDKWDQIIRIIGNDIPDCAKQTNFSGNGAKCPETP